MKNLSLKEGKISIILIFLLVVFMSIYYIFVYQNKENNIYIDTDNTEKIIDKNDLNEIEKRLDELDIDLDDILNELEL
jgi:hypothetical protein